MRAEEGAGESIPPAEGADDRPSRRHEVRARVREATTFVGGLLDLHRVTGAERRILLRQALTELARGATDEGPGPLEGLRPEALAKAVRLALDEKLLDDLDWLAPGPAGAALYALAVALPPGPEQRELGRQVLARLVRADAEAFTQVATRMALAGGKGLGSPGVMARVALVAELPISTAVGDGPLALALASRRELFRTYLRAPSTRSLTERRLAARLYERAAREAARRASQGDRSSIRLFAEGGALAEVHVRLLADREPLVWRHVAIARGLVAPWSGDAVVAIERELEARWSPTEWRRAIAAVGGLCATHPDTALKIASRAVQAGLLERDPGAAAAFTWGLARAAESEPEAAEDLLALAARGPAEDFADAVGWLGRELGDVPFVQRARRVAGAALVRADEAGKSSEAGRVVRRELGRDLADDEAVPTLRRQVDRAVATFASQGAAAALEAATRLVEEAHDTVEALEAMAEGEATAMVRRTAYAALRDVDAALLERGVVADLLRLDTRPERVSVAEHGLEALRQRLLAFVLGRELASLEEPTDPGDLPLRFAELRTLLHLVDSDPAPDDDGSSRARWQTTARSLATCLRAGPPAPLRRALMATFARALDALVRTGTADVADALIAAALTLEEPRDVDTLAEASMDPDVRRLSWRLAVLARAHRGEAPRARPAASSTDSLAPPPDPAVQRRADERAALEGLAEELAAVGTARADVLRSVLSKMGHALGALEGATSARALFGTSTEPEAALALENASHALVQVVVGARGRVFDEADDGPRPKAFRGLSSAVARLATDDGAERGDDAAVGEGLAAGLPSPFGAILGDAGRAMLALPAGRTSEVATHEPAPADQLPPWVPARRVLGAFFVQKPLGAGAVGSVFVVTRAEDRHLDDAERFALKVPDYNASAARHLSEAEFLAMFRAEASALMAVPAHENLARFVTFDTAARPKPILVMELVEGPNLERLLDAGTFDTAHAIGCLDQVLAGLGAMHEAGVGHLDVKPGNVILRGGETAVLVDFGLAGRNIRPGCGSGPYAAPEVWGVSPPDHQPGPLPADVYAFACLAFEALTGRLLFDAESEAQLLALHLGHDGLPETLKALAKNPRLVPLVELLFAALRRDPRARIGIVELRRELARITERLGDLPWPLAG